MVAWLLLLLWACPPGALKPCAQCAGNDDIDRDGFSPNQGDCDDNDETITPNGAETCDGKDNNCNGAVDEPFDADEDGAFTEDDGCAVTYDLAMLDCDDNREDVFPGADEICDGVDNNCNDTIDEGYDLDDDAFFDGDDAGCAAAYGADADCDDDDAAINPDADEICNNGIDDDCDGDNTDCRRMGTFAVGADPLLRGDNVSDAAGTSATPLGDVNGDGFDDFAVGAPLFGAFDAGLIYLVRGRESWEEIQQLSDVAATQLTGAFALDYFGGIMDGGADVTGDGTPDLVSSRLNILGIGNGEIYVLSGDLTGVISNPADAAAALLAGQDAELLGLSLSIQGDLTDDDQADLLAGAPNLLRGSNDRPGGAYLFASPLTTSRDSAAADVRFMGVVNGEYAGSSVANGLDFNGDGIEDIAIGANQRELPGKTQAGLVYLLDDGPWPENVDLASSTVTFLGVSAGDFTGSILRYADVNDDGYDDLFIGAPGNTNLNQNAPRPGHAYIVAGGDDISGERPLSDAAWIFNGVTNGDRAGYQIDIGDLDQDGALDLTISAPLEDAGIENSDVGAVWLFYGPQPEGSLDLATDADLRLDGDGANHEAVGRFMGDINGDGFSDLTVGVPGESSLFDDNGGLYLIFGQGL
ncbi:MAG: MopE-related protein [Myxococcota bacterium]